MFAEFNLKNWPLVIVKFNELKEDNEFKYFLKQLEDLYNAKQYFSILFDSRNISGNLWGWLYKMAFFMRKIKKKNPQYLKIVMFIYNGSYFYYIMNLVVFAIQRPFSKVYAYQTKETEIIDLVELFRTRDQNQEKFTILDKN